MANPHVAEPADNGPRPRNRDKTLLELRLALNRLQKHGVKISIAAVAKEAGVTNALLHNCYPDFAEEIRSLTGKVVRAQRNENRDLLLLEREKNRQLREQIDSQMKDIVKLASINESLRAEISLHKAIANGKVTKIQR